MSRRRILNALLAVAVVGAGVAVWATVGASASSRSSSPVTYDATNGTVLSTVSASGTAQAAQQVNVNFTTGGTLAEVDVKNGDQVTAGQVLAKVDPSTAQASLDLANAQLASAQAQLAGAEDAEAAASAAAASPATTGGSSGSGNGSTAGSAASVAQAQASVVSAQNQVTATHKTLDGTTLVAPIAGTVSGLTAQVGATVSGGTTSSSGAGSSTAASSGGSSSGAASSGGGSAGSGSSATGSSSSTGSSSASSGSGTPFVVITDLSVMDVQASFTEADAVKVHTGQKVIVTFSALPNVTVQGEVAQIATSATTTNGVVSFEVVITLDQTPDGLRPGMTANAQVVVDEVDNVLSVPSSALSGTGTTATVTVLGSDGKEETRTVTVGLRGDSSVQITSGLEKGDKIVRTTTSSTSSSTGVTTGARTAAGSDSGTLGGAGLTGGGGLGRPRGGG